jgi:hypothetical protein
MTSTQTCLAAARAPARLPLAALAQIPSSLLFRFPGSVGSRWMIDLQMSAYSAAPAPPTAAAVGRLGVEVLLAVEVDDFGAVVGVVGVVAAAVEVFAGVVVAVELVVPELLLLPHPAMNAPQSSTATSDENRPTDIASPLRFMERPAGVSGDRSVSALSQGYLGGRTRVGRVPGGTDVHPVSCQFRGFSATRLSLRLVGRVLGVGHTALQRWIKRGDQLPDGLHPMLDRAILINFLSSCHAFAARP